MALIPQLSGLKVLILENEPLICMEIVRILEGAGCVVVLKATSITEAFEGLKSQKPDMAFLDYRAIKENRHSPCFASHLHTEGIPYCFVTGELKRDVQDEYRADARVVAKPFLDRHIIEAAMAMSVG